MTIGNNIKALRAKKGLTQKDLAEKLNVTYQAVSRWENDDVEPSIDTLNQMTEVFGCTLNELFGKEEVAVAEEPVQQVKPVLAICEKCNKPLFAQNEIFRKNSKVSVRHGRHHTSETISHIYCKQCYDKLKAEEEAKAKYERQLRKEEAIKNKKNGFVWSTVTAIAMLIVAIIGFTGGDLAVGIGGIVFAVLGFCFVSCAIYGNNFIGDMWLQVASWGVVRFPGLIFSFDLDGVIWLIGMKILFKILGFCIGLFFVALATALGCAFSIFVYPFALRNKNREINSIVI